MLRKTDRQKIQPSVIFDILIRDLPKRVVIKKYLCKEKSSVKLLKQQLSYGMFLKGKDRSSLLEGGYHLSTSSNPLLILQNLKYFEDSLPKGEFVRVHRSYIVAMDKLNTVTKKL